MKLKGFFFFHLLVNGSVRCERTGSPDGIDPFNLVLKYEKKKIQFSTKI